MEPFIRCKNLVKIYQVADLEVLALQGLDLTIEKGELVGIVGTSGSGKSTLLNVLGGLIRPSAGQVMVDGHNLLKATSKQIDAYRREKVGFIWQQSARNLIPYLTAQENVALPMMLSGLNRRKKKAYVQELMEAVGLWEHRHHKLAQLSGGQQQRVAIAVALANKPALLLGDEPTGELDSATADEILALFGRLNQQYNLTTIIVTHDQQVARAVNRVITIRDGRTSSETVRQHDDIESDLHEFVVVDDVGRLQIPPELREKSQLGHRVTLALTDDGDILLKAVDDVTETAVTPMTAENRPQQTKKRSWAFWK